MPNFTVGPDIVRAVRRSTDLPIDVHMMVLEPERHIEAFASAGADIITVHIEATVHLQRTLHAIRQLGKRAGVALNPHTPETWLSYVLSDIDYNPGDDRQSRLYGADILTRRTAKISAVRKLRACLGSQHRHRSRWRNQHTNCGERRAGGSKYSSRRRSRVRRR